MTAATVAGSTMPEHAVEPAALIAFTALALQLGASIGEADAALGLLAGARPPDRPSAVVYAIRRAVARVRVCPTCSADCLEPCATRTGRLVTSGHEGLHAARWPTLDPLIDRRRTPRP